MNAPKNEPGSDSTVPTAEAMFEHEHLPFPPVPAPLAASLQQQGQAWFATRPVASTPYDFEHFLAEIEAQPGLPDYAVVGFDGHGTNSWAVHFYLVAKRLALFIQLPWGGAYLEPEPARADINDLFEWAETLQARLRLAESAGKIPQGMRLEIAASRFGHAGWRWLDAGQDSAGIPWNPSTGMKAALLQELADVAGGQRLLKAASPR
jgi:hypothetical protein